MNTLKHRRQLYIRRVFLVFIDIASIIVAFLGAHAIYFNKVISLSIFNESVPKYF